MRTTMPERGQPQTEVLKQLRELKENDCDWQHGRAPLYVFKATDEVYELGRSAFFEYFTENALGARRAFPSVKKMEDDVVDMALGLMNAPEGAVGFMTSGGTESIIQAVQTCRDLVRKQRKQPTLTGNIVAADSVHPAFNKAAKLMDLEVRRVPVGLDLRADVAAMEAAIDADTIMLVGSAPCFPYGVIDPIAQLGQLAERRGIWLHVDACVGGFIAPFARMIGREIPDFDLGVPGVSSMSADLHKFGFTPKPASTVLYTSAALAEHHNFDFSGWPNGRFFTPTIVGTRPAGGVAAAWAIFNHLGIEGYKAIARDLLTFVDRYKAGVTAIPGMEVLGKPHLSIVAFGSDELDIFRVAEVMSGKGWLPGLVQKPKGIHRMMSMIHEPALDDYLTDLKAAVGVVRQSEPSKASIQATY